MHLHFITALSKGLSSTILDENNQPNVKHLQDQEKRDACKNIFQTTLFERSKDEHHKISNPLHHEYVINQLNAILHDHLEREDINMAQLLEESHDLINKADPL